MQLRVAALLFVASVATPAAAQEDASPKIRLEISGGPLWKVETGEYGVERRGPGGSVGATFHLGRRLALGTDLALMHLTDPYPDFDEKTKSVHLTTSVLWRLSQGKVQGYVGLGALFLSRERCSGVVSSAEAFCFTETGAWPVVQLGVKVVNFRNGLVIGPDIRLEGFSLRAGLNVGWASIRR